jgi:hypothetical protein
VPNQRAAFGRPSDVPGALTAGLALVRRQPPFALHRTVDTGASRTCGARTGGVSSPSGGAQRLSIEGACRSSAKGRQVPSGIAKSPLAASVAPIPTRSERSSGFEELLARHCAWAYFPREVFFFGFGFGFGFVPLLVPAVCRFCFLVAIFPPDSVPVATGLDASWLGELFEGIKSFGARLARCRLG